MTRATFIRHGLAILFSGFVFLMAGAALHHAPQAQEAGQAARGLETVDENGTRIYCGSLTEARSGVWLGYIVPCVTKTIENTTIRMSKAMIDWLEPTLYAFISLVLTLFGVRVLQGGGQLQAEAMLLLLKVSLVIGLLQIIPTQAVPALYKVMNEAVSVVTDTIGPDISSLQCDAAKYRNPETIMLWSHMDCLAGHLFGIAGGTDGPNGEKRPNMLLASSIFGLLAGFLFSGTLGVLLFFSMLGMLWSVFMLIVRTTTAFLNGYLYASMMLLIAPLFMPLILFRGTASYFESWWKGILGGIILPVVISSYAMFALVLYDKMLFATGADGGEPSLLYKLMDNDLVKQVHGEDRRVCNILRIGNPQQRADALGLKSGSTPEETQAQLSRMYSSPLFNNIANPLLNASDDSCADVVRPTVDLVKGLNVESNKQGFMDLFKDSFKLLVLGIILNMGYSSVQSLARRLSGSGAAASTLDIRGGVDAKLNNIGRNVRSSISGHFVAHDENGRPTGQASRGGEFIQQLATLPTAIGRGLSNGSN